ncbi:hypothetical protein EN742_08765 [Mesorhizobium sp. M4A.F.Ca.ET.020.02.1.1]|uniref:hypothetical protein n=1 Tax=unclassified Mesorhizobium TaxID=325217 RepID=UPI000FCC775F|nr:MULTISPECIES: hypothetical protein [unclassified Mesorhizobium]RVD72910.1 hypothetical protein EN751_07625 [Mesorhizobium sp. M4A.F.Ca.ET.029.04.2.1]RVC78204.1 hypothetical protein EN745_19655 [Mesorhizobium sp. M4A.F.Ca.ET.022.05.2.1]RVD41958.1 hypothetical protein EN742_08765 [Mesorhizobium sp. M4A.F.Ca.ET.020.02.1.1]RWD30430.1 MAG: hypothetical protein EOS22_06790 [Mesorhizobium sp.]TIL82110.1 MAG: hypothetical protein E5Y89_06570 [Mesorhizobium sp.]
MDTQLDDKAPEDLALENALAESLTDLAPDARTVSEDEFVEVVGGALEAVGGTLLFKMCVQDGDEAQHVAAACVGDGGNRQFLLLTLPTVGGALKVETASRSTNPVAGIAAAYAGLMDVFQTAA